LPNAIHALNTDIALLKAIENKQIDTRSFDFDGNKYQRDEAPAVCAGLEEELAQKAADLQDMDKQLFHYFYTCLHAQSPEAATSYENELHDYFVYQKRSATQLTLLQDILGLMQEIFAGQTISIDSINATLKTFKDNAEKELKSSLQKWNADGVFDKTPALKNSITGFMQKDYCYFSGDHFLDAELARLNEVIHEGWAGIQDFIFEKYKRILEVQEMAL
jgi:hypothetical protein